MLTKENQHLLELLADILHNKTPKAVASEEWPAIRDELKKQGVLALTAMNFRSFLADKESQANMHVQLNTSMHNFYKILETQTAVASALEESGIPVAVLKGSAAAMSYPVPELRLMGDIDILVPKEKFEEAFQVLADKGYKCEDSLKDFFRHAGFKSNTGIEIELHQFFASNDTNEKFRILNNYLYEALEKIEHVEINGYMTPVLPAVANGIVLLSHLNHHLQEGIGLRHVIDWMCFVEKYIDDEFWHKEFAQLAEHVGLITLAKETTAMCKKYLGLSKNITWCGMPNNISDKYIEYVLGKGNYVVKQEQRETKTISVLRTFRNPLKGIISAQRIGIRTWELLSDYPWLKPFAWIYQIQRWIRHGLENKVGIASLRNAICKSRKEKSLLEELELIDKL